MKKVLTVAGSILTAFLFPLGAGASPLSLGNSLLPDSREELGTELMPIVANTLPEGEVTYTLTDPDYLFQAKNNLMTNIPATFSGAVVNTLVGADAFYKAGITGQGAILANVEAGHIWNGHETLTHVTQFVNADGAWGTTTADLFDRHATWVGSVMGGRMGGTLQGDWQAGIAYGSDLQSGAIATLWIAPRYADSFSFNSTTFNQPFQTYFGTANVINSSWGFTDPGGIDFFTIALDGFAAMNPSTTYVVAAGNEGPGSNTVGSPGSGYNAITVGALNNGGANQYSAIADFSSRGPQDWSRTGQTVPQVRGAVDIVAPGTNLTAAYYGGETGGNNPDLGGSPDGLPGGPNFYSPSVAGTSFSAPIVAGAAALVNSASLNLPDLADNPLTRDARVVKAVLMNGADKPAGWDNAQVPNSSGGVDTTQSLDWTLGAGSLNLEGTYENYVNAITKDLAGLGGGSVGSVGFDYGVLDKVGDSNWYEFDSQLLGGEEFTVTLTWFRNRTYNPDTLSPSDISEANLNLYLVDVNSNERIASSVSIYNNSEHLHFVLPRTSQYALEVARTNNLFGRLNQNQVPVPYGLAWRATAIPEPLTVLGSAMAAGFGVLFKWRLAKHHKL